MLRRTENRTTRSRRLPEKMAISMSWIWCSALTSRRMSIASVYHPHAKLHHIKKENIGLIEVMGLAVLPSRLKQELADLAEAILSGGDIRSNQSRKHADSDEFYLKEHITSENINEILQKEVGLVFEQVLEDAGVYKCTPEAGGIAGSLLSGLDKEEIMERDLFLRKYRIEQEDFDAAGVSWGN